ncbi:MAG: efflux transporter periplasmic adaptor subunit [Rubrivivax sp. SCN 70-15]|nr:MAG: efflux transporter periplasmic adaptor subunit [Rubrivivax sp. SCN 70-15]
MKTNTTTIVAAVLVAVAGIAGTAWWLGMQQGMAMMTASSSVDSNAATEQTLPQSIAQGEEATRRHIAAGIKAGDMDPVTGRKVLYYHDPMVPGNKFDKPAKSPFMDMMLVPVYAGGAGDDGSKVTVSPRIQQNLGVRTAEVVEATLAPQVAAVGNIAWNERDLAVVQARATGFVEKLHVRATLDRVAAGQPLAEIYVPEWIAAQEEFLAVRRMQGTDLALLVDGARQRMRQAGMSEAQIAQVERSGTTQPRLTLAAPIAGVVTELLAREGTTVMAGATLFRINGTGTVWAQAEVPESQAALLRPGAKVQARSPAVPGVTFDGKVQALLPEVDAATRTLKARLELANPGGRLVPGMFVQMRFIDMHASRSLVVPTEAVIQTGTRTVVMLAEQDDKGGRFRPVEVEAGIETGGQTEIRRGLQAGQRVVVSSQFLIDSEASLRGVEARLNNEPPPAAATEHHRGEARVESVGRDALTLSHGPIPSLKWGPMTMDFKPPKAGLPRGLQAGDRIDFEFTMDAEGLPQLTGVTPIAPPATAASTSRSPR